MRLPDRQTGHGEPTTHSSEQEENRSDGCSKTSDACIRKRNTRSLRATKVHILSEMRNIDNQVTLGFHYLFPSTVYNKWNILRCWCLLKNKPYKSLSCMHCSPELLTVPRFLCQGSICICIGFLKIATSLVWIHYAGYLCDLHQYKSCKRNNSVE